MNATAALAQALLRGEILTIKTAFRDFGITNLGREVGRAIERKFEIRISKLQREGKSRYDIPVRWFEYRLNRDDPSNAVGMEAMRQYVIDNGGELLPDKRPVGRPKEKHIPVPNNIQPLF